MWLLSSVVDNPFLAFGLVVMYLCVGYAAAAFLFAYEVCESTSRLRYKTLEKMFWIYVLAAPIALLQLLCCFTVCSISAIAGRSSPCWRYSGFRTPGSEARRENRKRLASLRAHTALQRHSAAPFLGKRHERFTGRRSDHSAA